MTDCIHTFFSAWGDPSAEARTIATEFYYNDPDAPAPIHGRNDYLTDIQMFGEMAPGTIAKVINISEKHGHARVAVDFITNENTSQRGQYFADLNNGKIARIVGFSAMGDPK